MSDRKRGGKEDENQILHASQEKALLAALFVLASTFTTNRCAGTDDTDYRAHRRRRHHYMADAYTYAHTFNSLQSHNQSQRRRA